MASAKEFFQVKNWETWVVRIQEVFALQRVMEMVQRGIQKEEGSASYEESNKRVNIERTSYTITVFSTQSAKEVWKFLNKAHSRVVSNKDQRGAEEERGD